MRGTRKIDWLNHFLEFIVVVIGILLAFQLNTCREDKKEVALVNSHIANVFEETSFNKERLENSLQNTERLIGIIDSLIPELMHDGDIEKINGLTFRLLEFYPTYLKKTAYNSFKESGDIRYVKDFKVKNDIITLYEFYDWAKGMDEATYDTFNQYFYPYMVENFDMLQASVQDKSIYTNKKFKNIISGYRYILISKRSQNKNTLERIKVFITENKQ